VRHGSLPTPSWGGDQDLGRRDRWLCAALAVLFLVCYLALGAQLAGPLLSHHMTIDGADSEAVNDLLTAYDDY